MNCRALRVLAASAASAFIVTTAGVVPAAAQAPPNTQVTDNASTRIGPWASAKPQTATAPAAPAEDEVLTADPERFNVTAFIGPGFGGGLQSNALEMGVAGGYNFTTRVGVEGEFGYARQGSQGLVDTSSNIYTFSANALYHFPVGRWLPYGTFGIGMLRGSAEVTGPVDGEGQQVIDIDDSATDFGFNIGGGVKTRIAENVRFRGDLRFFDGGDLPNFWRLYGGLTFLLGR